MNEDSIKLLLIGAREDGQAGVVLDFINESNLYEVIGFLDDNTELHGKNILGIPVLGSLDAYLGRKEKDSMNFFICIGNNSYREVLHKKIVSNGGKMVNIIHSSSFISKSVRVGEGVFVGANVCIIHNSVIGNCTLINNSTSIDHDNEIEDYVNISPGCHTSGRVIIKKGAFLGTGVSVIPDIIIDEDAIIGAGSVVIRNVEQKLKVAGNPAKELV